MASQVEPLTLATELARKNPDVKEIQFVLEDPTGIQIDNIGTAFANHVFRITSRDRKESFVIKHAAASSAAFSEVPLPRTRIIYEYKMLLRFLQTCPGSAPQPFCIDRTNYTMAMAYMDGIETLHSSFMKGQVDQKSAVQVGTVFAEFHNANSKENISADEWSTLTADFGDTPMKEAKGKFTFQDAWDESNPWNKFDEHTRPLYDRLLNDPALMSKVKRCASTFYDTTDCLIHGDAHYTSVFVRGGAVATLDLECGCLGPRSYDVAVLVTAYILFFFRYYGMERRDLMSEVRAACTAILETYLDITRSSTSTETFLSELSDISAWYLFRLLYFTFIDDVVPMTTRAKCTAMETCLHVLAEGTVTSPDEYIRAFMPTSLD